MSADASPEDASSSPQDLPPSSRQLDGLLGELDDHFDDRPPPPPPPEPEPVRDPARGTPKEWFTFALTSAIVCAALQAFTQRYPLLLRFHPNAGASELAAITWGLVEGFVVGLQGGWACWAWQSVRAERFNRFTGSILILVPSFLSLVAFAFVSARLLGASSETFEYMVYLYALSSVGLLASLYAHVGSRSFSGNLIGSYLLTQVFLLPITWVAADVFGIGHFGYFWRANFPAYLAFPLAWSLLRLVNKDPLPYQAKIA